MTGLINGSRVGLYEQGVCCVILPQQETGDPEYDVAVREMAAISGEDDAMVVTNLEWETRIAHSLHRVVAGTFEVYLTDRSRIPQVGTIAEMSGLIDSNVMITKVSSRHGINLFDQKGSGWYCTCHFETSGAFRSR